MLFPNLSSTLRIRPAQPTDQLSLSNLFHFEAYNFRHLDWKRPLDWLGSSPFLVAEEKERVVAALICPPEPPEVAWLRAFAASGQARVERVWRALWQEAYRELKANNVQVIAAICMDVWMQKLLTTHGFEQSETVVVLSWDQDAPLAFPRYSVRPRVMTANDLSQVYAVDRACFAPLWQNSQAILETAFLQAIFATVLEDEQGIVGYQISTPSPRGGHLARLGVHPRGQGQGMGYALVYDLLIRFTNHALAPEGLIITVNTQAQNAASLAVYQKANFHFTGHQYPVYTHF
ncbi:MAG TPA: GNAT family N-acetyltransferase [Anaerolineales bacterium]|nr:GNAT family N-acetyltransferase [Anaerolineales bacterium]